MNIPWALGGMVWGRKSVCKHGCGREARRVCAGVGRGVGGVAWSDHKREALMGGQ